MEPSFEIFDRTADAGIRIHAPTRPQLLQPVIDGLYAFIGERIPTGTPKEMIFDLTGSDAAVLLRDFLAELLFAFEQEQRMATRVDVAACPHAWPHSSFAKCVPRRAYAPDWAWVCDGRRIELPDFGDLDGRAGE